MKRLQENLRHGKAGMTLLTPYLAVNLGDYSKGDLPDFDFLLIF